MLRFFRSISFEHNQTHRAYSIRQSCLIFTLAGFIAVSTTCLSSFGQELGSGSSKTAVEADDDAVAEDLVAAMKSMDEALSKNDVLAEQRQMRDRLVCFGVFGVTFLALMGVLFGYLRLDHATRGFHSGRLQMLAAFISILILATCYFLWSQVLFK